ncbi:MAG: redoxin domain-containing protein [Eubacteriales bacterium]
MTRNRFKLLPAILSGCLALTLLASCRKNTEQQGTSSTDISDVETTSEPVEVIPDPGDPISYTFTVKTRGGLAVSDVELILTDPDGNEVAGLTTDQSGKCTETLPAWVYTVSLKGLGPGYSLSEEVVKTTPDNGQVMVTVETGVITEKEPGTHNTYEIGELMYDYTFTIDGEEVKLSELLETKKLVVINFWATWCGPCTSEFPALNEAYEEYKDSVAVIALSISDSELVCKNYQKRGGYGFPMIPESGIGIYSKFQKGGIPLSIYIDRYGMYVGYDLGSDTSVDSWKAKFNQYTSDRYIERIA